MRLYKRGAIWWVRWGRRRETTKCTDRKAAELYARRLQRRLADPAHAAANEATVDSALERFLVELRSEPVAEGTRHMYRTKAGHVGRLLGAVRLVELDHAATLGYVRTREAEGAKQHTVHKELTTLRRALRSAARAGEFPRDVSAVLPRYGTGYQPTEQWVDEADLWAVMRALPPGRAAWIAFVVATGANTGDVERARREDITESGIRVRGTKTSARPRMVPRLSTFAELIAFAEKHADGEPPRLFRPWANVRRDLAEACVRAGVAPFPPTRLRHTTATWLVRAGVPLHLVAKVLGHASTAMLQRVYGHLDALDVGELIERQVGVQKRHTRKRHTGLAEKPE